MKLSFNYSTFIVKINRIILPLVIITLTLFLQSCSSLNSKAPKKEVVKAKIRPEEKLGNFDRVKIPNEAPVIARMIAVVQPKIDEDRKNKIANQIQRAIVNTKIEPQIMVAIIDTESDFKPDRVSSTGDLSLAQVNVEIWNRELARMNLELIKKDELKKDQGYALKVMAQILSILKNRYGKKDRRWYARYHSHTLRHKREYLHRLEIRMKMLSKAEPLLAVQ